MMARRCLRVLAPGGLLVALFFVAPVAGAAPASDDDAKSQQATDLYKRANALYNHNYNRNDWAEAKALYLEAWKLKQTFDIASNLGAVELDLGEPREAAKYLTIAFRMFPVGGKKTNSDNLEARLKRAREQVGALRVTVNVEGAEVKIDDVEVGKAPLADALFVSPGADVTVRASAPGYEPMLKSVRVAEGESADVDFPLRTWAEAEQEYLGKWPHEKSYEIACKLGAAEFALGKYREAAKHLDFARRKRPPKDTAAQCQQLEANFKDARAKVGAVAVLLNVSDARVTIDGVEVERSELPFDIFVDAGKRTIVAQRDGYLEARATIIASLGSKSSDEVRLILRRSVVPGAVLASIAGAAVVTGAALLAVGAGERSTSRSLYTSILGELHSCVAGASNFDLRCPQLNDTALSAGTFHNAGVGVLTASAVAVGTAVYFFAWRASAPNVAKRVQIIPTVSGTNAGVLFAGSF